MRTRHCVIVCAAFAAMAMVVPAGFCLELGLRPKAPRCPVRLNEIMINPRDDNRDEYIELYNTSSTRSVDISEWTIEDRTASGVVECVDGIVDFEGDYDRGLPGTVIPPGGYALIVDSGYNGAHNDDIDYYHVEPLEDNFIMVTTDDNAIGDGLNNEADSIRIVTNWREYNTATSPYQTRSLSWTSAHNFHVGITQPSFEFCSEGLPVWRKCTYWKCTPARTNSHEE